MKKIQGVLAALCLVVLNSCQTPVEKKEGDFKLLPSPQEFSITGISSLRPLNVSNYFSDSNELPVLASTLTNLKKVDSENDAQIIFGIDSNLDLKAEGYILDISDKQILISGKDEAGLFYAFQTLGQLMEDASEQEANLPISSIKDYPSLAYRSIQLDIKHHIEKTEYYYSLMDKLAKYKVNAIIAEVEDKIKFVRQPLIGAADALSIEEWQKLCNYAKARNIEISPLVQGLGHASFILKHDAYKELRDDPESDWAFNPLDPRTYEIQFDLYLDAIEATPHGKYLHIGGDEVHTTGRNSGKSQLELQLLWLDKVCKFAAEHNRIPIFWDDMPLKHAEVYRPMFDTNISKEEVEKIWEENEHRLSEFLDQFPKNCIYMRWNYSSPQTFGNHIAMKWFTDHGMSVMGATAGQTRWVLMPQNESNIDNIRSFALSSIENGLNGLLLTLWDDDSPHFELYMRGILAFAEYTWSGDKRSKEELKSVYRHRQYSNKLAKEEYAFIDQLEGPVAFWKNALLNGNKRNYLKKSENAIAELVIDIPDTNKKGEWTEQNVARLIAAENAVAVCDSVATKIVAMKTLANRNRHNLEVYEQVNNLVRFSSNVLLILRDYDQSKNSEDEKVSLIELSKLSDQFKSLRSELEEVYGKTRVLTKSGDYELDQDHHAHLANQSTSFDWQFYSEILFLQKLEQIKF
ncbi:MAG: beta-N-acetylhexosaminidase [Cyclobacteriaceae bacterium]|nr:beta-N-acetylhexosaminidase [Cyclobacteriaceae bacterium]